MQIYKYYSSMILITTLIIIIVFARSGQAKSLYVDMHNEAIVKAYKITGDQIQYQTDAQNSPSYPQGGPVGITLDPDYGFTFVTSEGERSSQIDLYNAKTMVFEEILIQVEGSPTLAGIVFDKNKQKLYVIGRETNWLFVYFWYEPLKILLPDGESYKEIYLDDDPYAYGLALDESKSQLYVTNATNTVHYFDTESWEHKGSISIVVSGTPREAVGIAIDSQRHYMYTGAFTGVNGSHYYLVRTDITDPNNPTFSEKNVGAYVVGLAVDEETGYLYVGTKYDSNYTIQVFNTLTWPSDPCFTLTNGVNGPAGMCLGGDIQYKPPYFHFEKVDINEPNSVLPDSNITYRITYGPNGVSHDNVVITDFLPGEVNYINLADTNYNSAKHTYTWSIGHLNANDPNNSVTLTVKVNYGAAPNSVITNFCEIESDDAYKTAVADTNVGFWQPDSYIIYVDYFSPCSPGTGMSWQFAYRDLQDALERAADGNDHQIWVANGTYIPSVEDPNYGLTFKLINGVSLYGHFAGDENSIYQRNLTNPASETILSGEGISTWYLVTASGLNQITNLDGFTITGNSTTLVEIETAELTVKNCLLLGRTSQYGINAVNSDFTVSNCTIQDFNGSEGRGISVDDSNFTITCCDINNNGCGVYVGSSLDGSQITNNIIHNNISAGIAAYAGDSLLLANNWIHHNISDGIYTYSRITFRNNTIVGNGNYGIYDDNIMGGPTIHNCIIWNNAPDLLNTGWDGWYHATYSCFTNYDIAVRGTGNIYGDANDPNFVSADSNNFHLDPNSPCIDTGDPAFSDYNQTDIDGEPRISNSMVDMGADEYYWPKADYDRDGIVNFIDFSFLAACWSNINPAPAISLDADTDVDMDDLSLFCKDWLWIAPWSPLYELLGLGDMGMMSQTSTESPILAEEMPSETVMEEPSESNDQPMSAEQIQALIDWTEQLWESNPELIEMAGQAGYDIIMESLTEQLNE